MFWDSSLIVNPSHSDVIQSGTDDHDNRLGDIAQALDILDLDCIKVKLMNPDEGEGWTREYADKVEKTYKRFLHMTAVSSTPVVPTRIIDEFWHQHILDTEKYADDCDKVFGTFVHHFPYFGMRGKEDAKNLRVAFEETCRLYKELFGEDYTCGELEAKCYKCGSACGGSHCKPKDTANDFGVRPSLA